VAAGAFDALPPEQRARTVEFEGHVYATLDFAEPDGEVPGPTALPECVAVPEGWEISTDAAAVVEQVIAKHPWGTHLLTTRSGAGFTTKLYLGQPGSKISNYELMSTGDGRYGPRRCLPSRPSRVLIRYPAGIDPSLPKLVAGPATLIKGKPFKQLTATSPSVWRGVSAPVGGQPPAPAVRPTAAAPQLQSLPAGGTVSVGLLFPGQGSQYVKMLDGVKDLPAVKDMLAKAVEILGYDILQLCLEGPEEKLEETRYCQPAIFIGGLAGLEKLRGEREEAAARPRFMAGLSLGEYTALCAAGVFDFEDGLRLVKLRGEAMHEAANVGKQLMLSVVGLERERLEGLCAQARERAGPGATCQISNFLFPNGFSCGGSDAAINELKTLADDNGALQTKILKTAGAFHTTLMQPAQERLSEKLEETLPRMKPPGCTVYMNATAEPVLPGTDPREIVENLKKQLTNSVLWAPSVEAMIAEGVTEYYELGPQKQLKAMMKRINPAVWKTTTNVDV